MLEGTENIRPLRDRVLVKELPWRNQTNSGLHLPDQAQKGEHVWRAVVVAVGPGKPALGLLRAAKESLDWWVTNGSYGKKNLDVQEEIAKALDEGFGIDGVKPGDVVLVSKYVHSKIGYGDETLCMIAASDILGVVEGEHNALRQALEMALEKLDVAVELVGHIDAEYVDVRVRL